MRRCEPGNPLSAAMQTVTSELCWGLELSPPGSLADPVPNVEKIDKKCDLFAVVMTRTEQFGLELYQGVE
ncbi:hypothetical protein H920_08136 [Fukomys damarensis]|uniref:Uncharacterized protein n=1 Tax=Fukomys damarensis TaxID=885580 RepID=A0A091DJH5_FUKDA|nr:hypothetical protein H920_08136 [Fukomys damarensis]